LRFLKPKLSYFHEGECVQAELGVQVVAAGSECSLHTNEERFTHLSLVLARKGDLGTIKKRLERKGILCEVGSVF
jgi:hypothetical protein